MGGGVGLDVAELRPGGRQIRQPVRQYPGGLRPPKLQEPVEGLALGNRVALRLCCFLEGLGIRQMLAGLVKAAGGAGAILFVGELGRRFLGVEGLVEHCCDLGRGDCLVIGGARLGGRTGHCLGGAEIFLAELRLPPTGRRARQQLALHLPLDRSEDPPRSQPSPRRRGRRMAVAPSARASDPARRCPAGARFQPRPPPSSALERARRCASVTACW